ncbi:MAG: hypothetical protein WBC44_01745 [Planctomycetaceae bacterium]
MTDPFENRSPNHGSFSEEEKRRFRFARGAIYVFPTVAGLLSVTIVIIEQESRLFGRFIGISTIALIANAFLAGIASAYTVARLHAVERGKWWRVGASFLFAFPMTLLAMAVFGTCIGVFSMLFIR